jgi:hypothetical protein
MTDYTFDEWSNMTDEERAKALEDDPELREGMDQLSEAIRKMVVAIRLQLRVSELDAQSMIQRWFDNKFEQIADEYGDNDY